MAQNTNKVNIVGGRGRGRGRGRVVPQEQPIALLRPSLLPRETSVTDMLNVLLTGPLEDLVVYRVLHDVLIMEEFSCLNTFNWSNHIIENMMIDASNANYVSKYVFVLFRHPIKGGNIREKFFSSLESYYEDRRAIRLHQGPVKYRNFVKFFVAVTYYARNVKFAPFDELIDGLVSLAYHLRTTCQEDIQIFALCVIRFSQYLTMRRADGTAVSNFKRVRQLTAAQDFARVLHLNANVELSNVSRGWLTLVIECKAMTNDLLEKYSPPLDKSTLKQFKTNSIRIQIPRNHSYKYSLSDISDIIDYVQ